MTSSSLLATSPKSLRRQKEQARAQAERIRAKADTKTESLHRQKEQARGQWIEQQEAAFVQEMLAAQQAAEQKRRAEEAKARQQAYQNYRAGEREIYPAAPKTGAYKRTALAKDEPPSPEEKKCGWNPLCWIGKGVEWIGNQVKSWFQPQPPVPTSHVSAIQTQAVQTVVAQFTQTAQSVPTHTPTATPTSTPVLYQQYKSVGSLTEWELRVGGQVAHNAHLLLTQADKLYFWGTGAMEENSNPPWAGRNIDLPIPMAVSSDGQLGWFNNKNGTLEFSPVPNQAAWTTGLVSTVNGPVTVQDMFAYTGNRVPFVCGDVPDTSYYMTGYNLQILLPNVSVQYPNRWPRSSYGYLTMLSQANNIHIWDIGSGLAFRDMPELGDVMITQTSRDWGDPLGAGHVVLVAEVHGNTPDQVIIIEGNPIDGTLVRHTVTELIDRIPDLQYLIYGHPNLPPTGGLP